MVVGTSGSRPERAGPVVASAFSLPARTCGATSATEPNMPWTSPFSTAVMASPVVRKWAGSAFSPASFVRMAAPKWPGVPAPKVPMNTERCAFAQAR